MAGEVGEVGEVGERGWRMSEVERRSQELLILMFHSGVWWWSAVSACQTPDNTDH